MSFYVEELHRRLRNRTYKNLHAYDFGSGIELLLGSATKVHRTSPGSLLGWTACACFIECLCHRTFDDDEVTCKHCLREMAKLGRR